MSHRHRPCASRSRVLSLLAGLLAAALAAAPPAAASSFTADFEADTPGAAPGAPWVDVRLLALPNQPLPSALVVATTDAQGQPTQALQTVDALAASRGVLQSVAPAPGHRVSGAVRVDRFPQPGSGATPVSDWPLSLGVAQLVPGSDVCCFPTPAIAIYVSALTQGFRLYSNDGDGTAADVDLGVAAVLGTWYRVELGVDGASGAVHSRIFDAASAVLLADRIDVLPDWTPPAFDAVTFFGGELSAPAIAGLGSLDDLDYAAVPEPGTLGLLGVGLALLAARRA